MYVCVYIYTQYTPVGIVCKQTFILKGINVLQPLMKYSKALIK